MLTKLTQKAIPLLRSGLAYEPMTRPGNILTRARKLFQNEEACASALLVATHLFLPTQFQAWEPESIWLALQEHKVEVPVVNRDKLLAITTLLATPDFYWDAKIFASTAMAFNSCISTPDGIDEASPAQLSWAVLEAELLMQSLNVDPTFDYEPKKYTAVSCYHDGIHLAPELLVFCQPELDKLNNGDIQNAASKVQRKWQTLPIDDTRKLINLKLLEDPVDIQVAKLVAIRLYTRERSEQYLEQLHALRL